MNGSQGHLVYRGQSIQMIFLANFEDSGDSLLLKTNSLEAVGSKVVSG